MTKLTENVDEQPIGGFLAANAVFKIPYFQRAYKWSNKEFSEFTRDLTSIVDEEEDVHFLGAVITHEGYSATSQPNIYEIVDGQQRLATCTIMLCAIAKVLSDNDCVEDASDILSSFIYLTKPRVKHPSNLKFYPSKGDRKQFRLVIEDVFNDSKMQSALKNPVLRFLPSSGEEKGKFLSQYRRAKKFFSELADEDIDYLYDYLEALTGALTVVQIALKDPTNSSKIFERLNYRGVTVTTGDLVRNDIFSKLAAEESNVIDELHDNMWEPFFQKFPNESNFEKFFFPIGLIADPNVKKSDVFSKFQTRWRKDNLEPAEIIGELSKFQKFYLLISAGIECDTLSIDMNNAVDCLFEMGAPSSIYPLILQICEAVTLKNLDETVAIEMIELVEAFLVRRAVCGIEPTGLHAVFKGLWSELESKKTLTADGIKKAIQKRKTISIIEDEDFIEAIETRPLYGTSIIKYLLNIYEHDLPGDHPSDIAEIEHILPQAFKPHWEEEVTPHEHEELVGVFANLIVISPPQNKAVKNYAYSLKRDRFKKESMYATPKFIANKYKKWNAKQIRKRAKDLSAWANNVWPGF